MGARHLVKIYDEPRPHLGLEWSAVPRDRRKPEPTEETTDEDFPLETACPHFDLSKVAKIGDARHAVREFIVKSISAPQQPEQLALLLRRKWLMDKEYTQE